MHTTQQNGEFYGHNQRGPYTLRKETYSPTLNFLNVLRIIESMIGVKAEKNLVDNHRRLLRFKYLNKLEWLLITESNKIMSKNLL